MLRLSRLADYGVGLMLQLSSESPKTPKTARDLARSARVPAPTATKVLKMLARQGLLISHRGSAGGYSLAREASAISVLEVVAAVDGAPGLTRCTSRSGSACERSSECPARANWRVLTDVITRALAGVSVADMGAPLSPTLLERRSAPQECIG